MSNQGTNSIDELTEMSVGVPHTRGRITYIEPNDVYGNVNGVPVTPEYSDFCISFILTAEVVQRNGEAALYTDESINSDTNHVLTYTISWNSMKEGGENNVCFQQGTEYGGNNYLTTYYTDINFSDVKNSKTGIVEGLGVESVNVSFETYYAPTVKIRFVDVRGASLFGREEVIHEDNVIRQDNIWGCFFTFPYPKFRLQIKGFYGKPITFQLSCTDFRANFNSRTGNFEIDTTFIGYDYGLIADIPTSYLMAAPYSSYFGQKYWEEHVASMEWTLSDGHQPSTLLFIASKIKAVLKTIEDANSNTGTGYGSSGDGADDADRIEKESHLREVKSKFDAIVTYVKSIAPGRWKMYEIEENKQAIFLSKGEPILPEVWKKLGELTEDYIDVYEKYTNDYQYDELSIDNKLIPPYYKLCYENDVATPNGKKGLNVATMFKEYTNIDSENNAIYTPFNPATQTHKITVSVPFSPIPEGADPLSDTENFKEDINVNGGIIDTIYSELLSIETHTVGVRELSLTDMQLTTYVNSAATSIYGGFYCVNLGNIEYLINNSFTNLAVTASNESLSSTYDSSEIDSYLANLSIYDAAGLLPTIRNLFKTIMCHLETFMQMVYHCYDNIMKQSNGDRTPEKLGIKGYATNVRHMTNETLSVPPFPTVYASESKANQVTGIMDNVKAPGWIGYFKGQTEWEERKLIEGLALATQMIDQYKIDIPFSDRATAFLFCTPDDLFTDVFPNGVFENNINVPERLGCYLAMRASAMFGVIGYNVNQAKALGMSDALNYYSKLQTKKKLEEEVYGATTGSSLKAIIMKAATNNKSCSSPVVIKNTKDKLLESTNGDSYDYRYTEKYFTDGGETHRLGMVPVVEPSWESIRCGEDLKFKVFLSKNNGTNGIIDCTLTGEVKDNGTIFNSNKAYYRVPTQSVIDINKIEINNETRFINRTMFNVVTDDTVKTKLQKYANAINESEIAVNSTFTVGDYTFDLNSDDFSDLRNFIGNYWKLESNSDDFIFSESDYTNSERNDSAFKNMKRFYIREIRKDYSNNTSKFIFDCNAYYMQNEKEEYREERKCLLYLVSAGYKLSVVNEMLSNNDRSVVCQKVPYGALLTVGGLLWNRCCSEEYEKKGHVIFNEPYGKSEIQYLVGGKDWLPFIITEKECVIDTRFKANVFDRATRDKLISLFENFVANGWTSIRDKYEHRGANNAGVTSISQNIATEVTDNIVKDLSSIIDKEVLVTWGSMKKLDNNNKHIEVDKGAFEAYVSAFCSQLDTIRNSYKPEQTDEFVLREDIQDKDMKLAMYMYIKNLWDRWLMSYRDKREYFNVENFMGNFVFIDSLYRNVGDMIHINCEKLLSYLTNVNGKSMLFQLLASICQEHNCHFFALPDYFGFGENKGESQSDEDIHPEEKMKNMFTPMPYNDKEALRTNNKFIVMLVYNQSENLSDYNGYTNTSFDIWSHDGEGLIVPDTFNTEGISQELSESTNIEEKRTKRYGYNVPSFGIAFGRMNNAIFKNVNVGMSNPIATEQSIDALSLVAQRGGGNDKSIVFYGQDLFPVFTGYSYTCAVDMMGCAQIMPLMYCQLMNIPMFRGTYMVYSVTHTMKPGDMTTSFKAMKLSKNALPFADAWFTSSKYVIGSDGTLVPYGCGSESSGVFNIPNIRNGSWTDKNARMLKVFQVNSVADVPTVPSSAAEVWCKSYWKNEMCELHFWNANGVETRRSYEFNRNIHKELQNIFEAIFNMRSEKYGNKDGKICIYEIVASSYRNIIGAQGRGSKISNHSYGVAIDINATYNWWNDPHPDDMIHFRSLEHPVVDEFTHARNGHSDWDWGGFWNSGKDWMHFSYLGG